MIESRYDNEEDSVPLLKYIHSTRRSLVAQVEKVVRENKELLVLEVNVPYAPSPEA